MAVDPHGAVHVDTVELDTVLLVLAVARDGEVLAVPADTRREIPDRTAAWSGLDGVQFDAPVVRNIEQAPGLVVETGALRVHMVSQFEFPVRIKIRDLAGLGG